MRFPKLTQLQSRFAAFLGASVTIILIYFLVSSPRFAYAAELNAERSALAEGYEDVGVQRANGEGEPIFSWPIDRDDDRLEDEKDLDEADDTATQPSGTLKKNMKRANTQPSALPGNNAPANLNIDGGEMQLWAFENASLWVPYSPSVPGLPAGFVVDETSQSFMRKLRKRWEHEELSDVVRRQNKETRPLYISINTCLQPLWNRTDAQTESPPQLTLYVSTETEALGPGSRATQQTIPLIEGFANTTVNASSTTYIAVSAPTVPQGFTGSWNYELAASIDDYYHGINNSTIPLQLVDTDTTSALLVTTNLTSNNSSDPVYQQWLDLNPPFIVFARNQNVSSVIDGVRNSFCGLKNAPSMIVADQKDPLGTANSVQMEMTTWGTGDEPKEQFFIRELNLSSAYEVVLAMDGNSTNSGAGVVGGGGRVWPQLTNLYTKSDGNCALLFNLSFCSDVAYAVPYNPNTVHNFSQFQSFYDQYASDLYQNFSYTLELVPCNTTATAQYSLAQNCTSCAAAYKRWLCAVTIPRCDDFTSEGSGLFKRNVGQISWQTNEMLPDSVLQQPFVPMSDAPGGSSAQLQTLNSSFATNRSRIPTIIDYKIQPGPYQELLPCEDLCYGIVQACPAMLGFSCPYPGRGLEAGYNPRIKNANLSCNYPGAVYYTNIGSRTIGSAFVSSLTVLGILLLTQMAF